MTAPPTSPNRSRRPSFSMIGSLGFRRTATLSPTLPPSVPTSPPITPLAIVRENPLESEPVLHIRSQPPTSPLALPPLSSNQDSYFDNNFTPPSSSSAPRSRLDLESQRFQFPPPPPLAFSSHIGPGTKNASTPPPPATRESSTRRSGGGGANEPKSAWSDWGTSIASSSSKSKQASSGSKSGKGGGSSAKGGGSSTGATKGDSTDSSGAQEQKTTDPSSVEVPARNIKEDQEEKEVEKLAAAVLLEVKSSKARANKIRSSSNLDLKVSRRASIASGAIATATSTPLPSQFKRRRNSLPDSTFPLHLQQHQYTKADVQDLVEGFGYSTSLASFMTSSLGLSATGKEREVVQGES